jgi:hypothetical protein
VTPAGPGDPAGLYQRWNAAYDGSTLLTFSDDTPASSQIVILWGAVSKFSVL